MITGLWGLPWHVIIAGLIVYVLFVILYERHNRVSKD